jgi:hypothetical protein
MERGIRLISWCAMMTIACEGRSDASRERLHDAVRAMIARLVAEGVC